MRQFGGVLLAVTMLVHGAPGTFSGTEKERPAHEFNSSGVRLISQSRYAEAEKAFARAVQAARLAGPSRDAARFLSNLGSARLYQQDFTGAVTAFLEAREAAHALGLREVEAGIWSNLAALYGLLAAWPAAETAWDEAARLMPPGSKYRPAILAQRLRVALRRAETGGGQTAAALRLWRDAMDEAQRAGDLQVERHLWSELSALRFASGDIGGAEDALANEFRLVRLHRLPDRESLFVAIGRLRLAQQRPREALDWFNRASLAPFNSRTPVNPVELAGYKARAHGLLGGPAASLESCRKSWRTVLRWRHMILPEPRAEIAGDVAVAGLAEQYAGAALDSAHVKPGDPRIVEAWAAIEQTRALGLLRRATRRPAVLEKLGPSYQALAAEHNEALLQNAPNLSALESRLAEMEALAGLGAPAEIRLGAAPPEFLRRSLQATLGPGRTLFTFLISGTRSAVWAVTRNSMAVALLPPRSELQGRLAAFKESVSANRPAALEQGRDLYRRLFGALPARALAQSEWLISADDLLLETPVAALVERRSGRDRYLAEIKTLHFIPSALWLVHPATQRPPERILAVGDAVHNAADPRLASLRPAPLPLSFWLAPWRQTEALEVNGIELASLPGSRAEVDAVGAAWKRSGRGADLLTGFAASGPRLDQALRTNYTDIHFATHVMPAQEQPRSYYLGLEARTGDERSSVLFPAGEPILALSLNRRGEREGLDASTLSRFRLSGSRVVLNGCSSANGTSQPGAGLLGFTSAWLAAGANSVVASLWPMEDDGALFKVYYKEILTGSSSAAALRAAQTAMIGSASWRSQPRYWAAYFHVGKD